MSKFDPNKLQLVREGLGFLVEAVTDLQNREELQLDPKSLPNRSISGDKIMGGTIARFKSIGIEDKSTKLSLLVGDDGIVVNAIETPMIIGDTTLDGNLRVDGELSVKKLHVDEVSADIRQERSSSLEFHADGNGVYSKGLLWTGNGVNKQLMMRPNPDRLWTNASIDLHKEESFKIDGRDVVTADSLGNDIRYSKLQTVGALRGLQVNGNLVVDQFLYWDSENYRLGIGTESPNAQFSIMGWDQEFVVDVESRTTKIGNYTTHPLEIVTDDTPRITITESGNISLGIKGSNTTRVSVHGNLGVGIANTPDDVSIQTANGIRMQGKKFQVGSETPKEGTYRKGDIIWNDDPKPTGYVGWICVREGTPGEWKPFGSIAA